MKTDIIIDIEKRCVVANGRRFGEVGTYEKLVGSVIYLLDPEDSINQIITDLGYAPRNTDGKVRFSADLFILRPVDSSASNHKVIYGVNNRGRKLLLKYLNDAPPSNNPMESEQMGNGFLMNAGYSIVWSGWQGNLLPGNNRLTASVPIAKNGDEKITGRTWSEYVAEKPDETYFPLSGSEVIRPYKPHPPKEKSATLTKRKYQCENRKVIPYDEWEFSTQGKCENSNGNSHCLYPKGFTPGWIYELTYTAEQPLILGLGFAAVRDLVSFFRYEEKDFEGNDNPLFQNSTNPSKAYAWGSSQSGRYLREYTYLGFNSDAQGRRVFDAITPYVAGAGRIALNYRFGQPGRFPRQHREKLYPSDEFPFSYDVTLDSITGKADGIRKRPRTDPLIMHIQTSSDYWNRRGSLVHTDTRGADLGEQEGVRIYAFASAPHYSDPFQKAPESDDDFRYLSNPINLTPFLRTLFSLKDEWASGERLPPKSQIPTRSNRTLVPDEVAIAKYPDIPDVDYPKKANRNQQLDFGSGSNDGIISKIPPEKHGDQKYPVLVPQVDKDGNEIAGIKPPEVAVPRATYTGWNLRPNGSSEKTLGGVTGAYFPFPKDAKERQQNNDPRSSVEERYKKDEQYILDFIRQLNYLVDMELLLEDDANEYVKNLLNTYEEISINECYNDN